MTPIPISAAQRIADDYGYHQVVVIARAVGKDGGEHVTTYGSGREHCAVAAHIGAFLRTKIMGWPCGPHDRWFLRFRLAGFDAPEIRKAKCAETWTPPPWWRWSRRSRRGGPGPPNAKPPRRRPGGEADGGVGRGTREGWCTGP